jgi:uncharacterized protein (TIGR02996 family)
MSDEQAFLDALAANSADDTARLVYADWLDEHDEPVKAEYLRQVVGLIPHFQSVSDKTPEIGNVLTLARNLPSEWRLLAAARFTVVLYGYPPYSKINVIKLVRELTGMGLKEAKDFCETLPARFPMTTTLENAVVVRTRLMDVRSAIVAVHPSDQHELSRHALYDLFARLDSYDWEREDELPGEAIREYHAFLSATLDVTQEQVTEITRDQLVVRLAVGVEPMQLERRMKELQGRIPPMRDGQNWGIHLFSTCRLVSPSNNA